MCTYIRMHMPWPSCGGQRTYENWFCHYVCPRDQTQAIRLYVKQATLPAELCLEVFTQEKKKLKTVTECLTEW